MSSNSMDLIEKDNYLWMNIAPPEVALPGKGKVDICQDEIDEPNSTPTPLLVTPNALEEKSDI